MKQNKNPHNALALVFNAIKLIIAFAVLATASEIQASGRVFIRKAPGVDVKIQVASSPGFNSDWTNHEIAQDQNPVPFKFPVNSIRPGFNRVVPENPKEIGADSNVEPYYTGLEIKKGIFVINVKGNGNPKKYQVMLPEPAKFCPVLPSLKTEEPQPQIEIKPEEVFLNGEARRILVWNGKEDKNSEQLLICNDRIRSVNGKIEAVLNIMPLPGKPLQINRASDGFDALEEALVSKSGRQRKGVTGKLNTWNGRIASYCAQSIEAHNLDEFLRKAENMVSGLYGDYARLQWHPEHLAAIDLLLKKGYTWFSLDVSMINNWGALTEPIAYRTQTDSSAVLPLLAGKIGGAYEYTVTKALVITPGKTDLKNNKLSNDDVIIFGKDSFEFTADEIEKICPEAGAFCKANKMDKVFVQLIILDNKITEYPDDLVIVNQKYSRPAAETPANLERKGAVEQKDFTTRPDRNKAYPDTPTGDPSKNTPISPRTPQDNKSIPGHDKTTPPSTRIPPRDLSLPKGIYHQSDNPSR